MHAVLEKLEKIGIVPVIKIDDAEKAVPLAKALVAGGIPCVELTFRTAQAEEAIRRIAEEAPEVLLGAGTVLTTEQVDRAIGAGAQFIVSPGFNPKVAAYCRQKGILITPGCANPSDIEQAIELGLEVVKFFPAEQAGGLEYIKAISAPYPGLKFMPTGGINAGNIAEYIAFNKVLACGGSWMASPELINAGDFAKITALSREAVYRMLGLTVAHIDNGRITMVTNSLLRAVAHLEQTGIVFDHGAAQKDSNGNVTAIPLKETALGFTVQLFQKK